MGHLVFGFATLPMYEKLTKKLENKENSIIGAYSDDSFIGAKHEVAVNVADYDLRINLGPIKTTVLIGKCENNEELQHALLRIFVMLCT